MHQCFDTGLPRLWEVAGPPLSSVSIGPPNPTVPVGQTQQMDATGVYEDNSRQSITKESDWTSSDTAMATISSSGLVTGVSIETATVSAYDLVYSGSATVTGHRCKPRVHIRYPKKRNHQSRAIATVNCHRATPNR
jgi:hypothetical protein